MLQTARIPMVQMSLIVHVVCDGIQGRWWHHEPGQCTMKVSVKRSFAYREDDVHDATPLVELLSTFVLHNFRRLERAVEPRA